MAIPKTQEREFSARFHEYTRTLDCVHCGLCIPHCPTQGISGREADSPRGRIYLMRGYAEGSAPLNAETLLRLDQCIVCRNCETVCPSGIRMGAMMESFRHEVNRRLPRKRLRHHLLRGLLRHLAPHRGRLALLTDLLWLWQRIRPAWTWRVLRRLGLRRLSEMERMLPPLPPPRARRIETDATRREGLYPARGRARLRAALFLGCITSEWFAPTHRATIRMLNRAGCDVVVPDAQTCCGALQRHAGFLEEGRELYRRNREALASLRADVLVVNAAGCGAALKDPPPGLDGAGSGLGLPVRDVCEFLEEIGIPAPDLPFPRKVAYDQPCHLVHGQRVPPTAVRGLLAKVPQLELVDLPDSDRCCGSGGIYNLLHPEMAEPILAEKVAAILRSGAEVVVTGNPGCWMQIRRGLAGCGVDVLHPVDLLDQAYSDKE
jgi:glycolate oxidase iron-sulfur subunit